MRSSCVLALVLIAAVGWAEEPSREQRCTASFEAARKELVQVWSGFKKIEIFEPHNGEVSAGLDMPSRTAYTAMFAVGRFSDKAQADYRAPNEWKADGILAQRQFASGFAIVSLGAANPFAVPASAVKRLPVFIAAFRRAIDRCAE